jgi:hypothetical protein
VIEAIHWQPKGIKIPFKLYKEEHGCTVNRPEALTIIGSAEHRKQVQSTVEPSFSYYHVLEVLCLVQTFLECHVETRLNAQHATRQATITET